MIDFDSAEACGMALRMPLAQALDLASIDLVVVTGVKSSLDSAAAPQHLAALLDAHHYTDGLAFVAPGTPSNNTRNERAGFSSSDPRAERSFADEWGGAPFEAGSGSSADVAARAFGLSATLAAATFGRIGGAGLRDDALAADMRTALWPASFGYFLAQMIGLQGGPRLRGDRLGARPFHRARARCGSAAGPALRAAAVRCAAGDVARRLAAGQR